MKNNDIINDFVNTENQTKTNNVFIEKRAIYSYGYHFPMALKLSNNVFILNKDGYSMTTSRHKNALKRAIGNSKIIEVNTAQLKDFINQDIQNENQLILNKL
jgi:hypothetical protein